jgi:hypothetical protein
VDRPTSRVRVVRGGGAGRRRALLYLGVLSVMVLWTAAPPWKRVRQFRPWRAASPIDARYRDLLRVLPPDPEFGYFIDLSPLADQDPGKPYDDRRFKSQYALAPRILEPGSRPRHVIADLGDLSHLESICRLHALRPVRVFPNGVALLEHEAKP